MSNGKGDKPRPCNAEKFREGWDRIWGKSHYEKKPCVFCGGRVKWTGEVGRCEGRCKMESEWRDYRFKTPIPFREKKK